MNRRAALVLSIALACVALLVGWLAFGWKTRANPAASAADHARATTNGAENGAQLDALQETGLAAADKTIERSHVTHDSNALAAPIDDSELANASWVEGRLELAVSTPLDEEAWVVARGRDFERRPLHRARVGPDGRFRVAFAAGTQLGWLQLAARYNFLDEQGGIRPNKPPKDIVLKGRLGGCVRGRILVPASAQDFAFEVLAGRVSGGNESFDFFGFQRTEGKINSDLSYEVGGLEPGAARSVMLRAKNFVDVSISDVEIVKGGVTVRDLTPELGSRISGRIVGADGQAIAGVKVKAQIGQESGFDFFKDASVRTDAAGKFELVGISGGDLSIRARKSGFEPLSRDLGNVPAGTRKTDLELVLDAGLAITGVVKFEDGRPAARASLSIEDPSAPNANEFMGFDDSEPVEADGGGAFKISGLKPGSYVLTARAWVDPGTEVVEVTEPSDDRPRKVRKNGTPWSGRIERVPAGTSALVVTLTKGAAIHGRVLDSDGKPVERFIVHAQPDTNSPGYTSEITRIDRAFHDKDGKFALDGLRACGWNVDVTAKGLLDSATTDITVPGPNSALAFKLLRLAKLTGVVLGPDKNPVERAKVTCVGDSNSWRYDSRRATTRTNEKGEFTLVNAPLGAVRVQTEAPGFATSVPLRLEVGPSAVRTGIELVLTKGGTIRGVVVKDDGTHEAGRPVNLTSAGGELDKRATSDARGEFVFELLPPDTYTVVTTESREEMMKRFREGADAALGEGDEKRTLRATVDVRDGQTATVKLGGEPRIAIRMHGKVVASGSKPTYVVVEPFMGDGSDTVHRAKIAEDLTYETHLSARGGRKVTVIDESSTVLGTFHVDVPAGPDFERDFTLTSASIKGRVVNTDGKGVAGVRVRASTVSHRDVFDETGRFESNSGEDGTFTIERVPDGTYSVETIGRERWWEPSAATHGNARVAGIVVKEQKDVEGVELVLNAGGTINGSVRNASGELMPGVDVIAFDSSGHRFDSNRGTETDNAARFTIVGAPAGRVLLYARTPSSAGKAQAIVRDDGATEIDIVLAPCADLDVLVQDASGAPTLSGLELVDEDGRHFEEVHQIPQSMTASGARAFLGLPPGPYVVRAWNASAPVGEKSTRLSAGARAEVVLRATK